MAGSNDLRVVCFAEAPVVVEAASIGLVDGRATKHMPISMHSVLASMCSMKSSAMGTAAKQESNATVGDSTVVDLLLCK
jgi:hypothetical protein